MVLDRVVCPAIQLFGDDFPLVTVSFVGFENLSLFLKGPLVLVNFGIEMIDPSE